MATSEIEKLERRYAENPQGLTFAPLAEVHRKNGDVPRALQLLRAGLELHPNYIPASIVLGRCHWDLGDLPAAESAFAHVLRLDDENVIALKSLADINERLERWGEAQRWLQRLVSVDRSNEEAREQLSRLEAAKDRGRRPASGDLPHEMDAAEAGPAAVASNPPAAPPPPPVVKISPPAAEPAALDLTAAIADPPPRAAAAEPVKAPAPEAKSPAIEFLDTGKPAAKAEELSQPIDVGKPAAEEPSEIAAVPGLSTHEFVPPPREETYRLHPELTHDFGAPKEASKEPTLERFDVETAEEVELQSSGATEFRVPNAAEDFMDLAARMNSREVPPSTPQPPAVEEPLPAPRHEVPAPAPPPAPTPTVSTAASAHSKPSYSARDTKGQSVASFFQVLLAARPAGGNNSTPPSPDGSARSLGQGDHPKEPPVPSGGPLQDAAVSFDAFFSSPGGEPATPGGDDPKKDDLDSFQSWLQNLKR
jgi:hypothetical protein